MKKLYIIIGLFVVLGMAAEAQTNVINYKQWESRKAYVGTTADTASGTTVKSFDIFTASKDIYLYKVEVNLDSLGDGTNFTVELEGSLDDVNYTDITSVTWAVTSSDTAIAYTDLSTGVVWEYLRVKLTGAGSGAKCLLDNTYGIQTRIVPKP